MVRQGKVIGVAGSSGGSQIVSATAQTILRMIDMRQDPHKAVHSPRVHHQLIPNVIVTEQSQSAEMIQSLKEKGHEVVVGGIYTGVSACKRLPNGLLQGSGDERKGGSAVAY